jgi:hypothetical protein
VAELALDDHERNAFVSKLDGVSVPKPVRGESPARAAVSRNCARAAEMDHHRCRPRKG